MEQKIKRFILTCWDGDMYILTGYNSAEEIQQRLTGLEWARMPNGSQIKTSSIAKIQSYEDYCFQTDQKWRHKNKQFLGGKDVNKWWDPRYGYVNDADVKSITGVISNLPELGTGKLSKKEE